MTSCEPEFRKYPNISEDTYFLFPENIKMDVGAFTIATINGVDSCFVELIYGEDVIDYSVQYNIGDTCFYGGITTYMILHSNAVGEARFHLYNNRLNIDTTIGITVQPSDNSEGGSVSGYSITPSNTKYKISVGTIEFTVIGPEAMGVRSMDEFILEKLDGSIIINNQTQGGYIRKQQVKLSHVGSALLKFYNEWWDTLIYIEVLPEYTTYTEPPLDFDDTRDSVLSKLGEPDAEEPGILNYNLSGPVYPYQLIVRFREDGILRDYDVMFSDPGAIYELPLYIKERYYEYGYTTYNGYHIYTRGYDQRIPSPYSPDNKVLVQNFIYGYVSYKNPARSSEW